ncbi:early endosome antigen 1 isoform X1 [Diabrotica virgifera virgifera]|uniref:Transforming acidic coiled-coil-containing protein C-terminal domain-containing protein n=2 Tax=Diabrotica virgifera virgifera TaxID=50390 RepID=A0ABM5ISB8_DIAVI|nr:early endosome antigen 1 isoform X1 [Diabrotica virgifera virgifera]
MNFVTNIFKKYIQAEPSHKMDTNKKLDAVSNEALTSQKKTDENSDTNSEDQHSESIKFFDVQNETFENGEFKSLEHIVEEQNQTTDSGRHSLDFELQIGEPAIHTELLHPDIVLHQQANSLPSLLNEYKPNAEINKLITGTTSQDDQVVVNRENSIHDPSVLCINNKNIQHACDQSEVRDLVLEDSSKSTDSNRANIVLQPPAKIIDSSGLNTGLKSSVYNTDVEHQNLNDSDILLKFKNIVSITSEDSVSAGDIDCSISKYKKLLSLLNEYRQTDTDSTRVNTGKKPPYDNLDIDFNNQPASDIYINDKNTIHLNGNGLSTESSKIDVELHDENKSDIIKKYNYLLSLLNINSAYLSSDYIDHSVIYKQLISLLNLNESLYCSAGTDYSTRYNNLLSLVKEHRHATESLITSTGKRFTGDNTGTEYLNSTDIESSPNIVTESNEIIRDIKEKDIFISEEVIKTKICEDIVQDIEKNKSISVAKNSNEVQGKTNVLEKASENLNENNCVSKDLTQIEPSDFPNRCVKDFSEDRSTIDARTTITENICVKSEESCEAVEGNSLKVTEIPPAKFLEISVHNSSNELDKTTSCLEDDVCLNNSVLSQGDSSGASENLINGIPVVSVKTDCNNLDGTFVADNCSISSGSLNDTKNSRQSSPVKGDTEILNKSCSVDSNSNLPNKVSSDVVKDLINNNTEIIVPTSESEEKCIEPGRNYNFEMTDIVEKLNQQQAEISDLKLKLNAAQQHNASLELQIRQNEEIVIKTQAEALRTEQNYQQEVKQLKQKLNENSKIIEKDKIKELEEQLKDVKAKEAKLAVELSQRTKDDLNYQKMMDQYELALKARIAENKRLQEESETTRTHLTNLEIAFSDLHSKYEKTKATLQGHKANEEALLADLELAQSTNIQHEERYESLKAHATTQIEKSNKEIHDVKEQYDIEINKLRAFIRRLEIKVSSLEVSLQQKTEECEQLSALCDEVTGKNV